MIRTKIGTRKNADACSLKIAIVSFTYRYIYVVAKIGIWSNLEFVQKIQSNSKFDLDRFRI